jgi:hypothetical protein
LQLHSALWTSARGYCNSKYFLQPWWKLCAAFSAVSGYETSCPPPFQEFTRAPRSLRTASRCSIPKRSQRNSLNTQWDRRQIKQIASRFSQSDRCCRSRTTRSFVDSPFMGRYHLTCGLVFAIALRKSGTSNGLCRLYRNSSRGIGNEASVGKPAYRLSAVERFGAHGTRSWRPQDGFYSGQVNGQVDERVDGRTNRNEGLPPSAADKANRTFGNPINQDDCVEVSAIAPDTRPGWQARVRAACQ